MGLLVDGKWQTDWYDTESSNGRFERDQSIFRNWITTDGKPGPSGSGGFKAQANRYHLYVSLACPWAHRALIFRKLKGLENLISASVVNAFMREQGWTFEPGEGVVADSINNATHLYQIYTSAKPDYTGRVTVPVLWDKQTNTIVSNESSEIIRMLNFAFNEVGANTLNFVPKHLLPEIDQINEYVYNNINNGVYRAGFATTQAAYEEAVIALFDALNALDRRLKSNRYLLGSQITEADWRLFTT